MNDKYLLVTQHIGDDCYRGTVCTLLVPTNVSTFDVYMGLLNRGDRIHMAFRMSSKDEGSLRELRAELYNAANAAGLSSPAPDVLSAEICKKCPSAKIVPLESLLSGAA